MKILVLNGSPKGNYSVTLQTQCQLVNSVVMHPVKFSKMYFHTLEVDFEIDS